MDRFLDGASSFDQDLCVWGSQIAVNASTDFAFAGTSCPVTDDPVLDTAETPGPFCYACS